MSSEGLSPEYRALLDLCDGYVREHGSFKLGSHREPRLYGSFDTEPTTQANEYGNEDSWDIDDGSIQVIRDVVAVIF